MVNALSAYNGMIGYEQPGDPTPKRDAYYESSARLSYFKNILNNKLKEKNPEAYASFFKEVVDRRRKGDLQGAADYIQNSEYNEYLSAADVKSALGDDYDSYLNSIKEVNSYNVAQGQQPLYGNIEGDNDLQNLNYGRRFASLTVTPSLSVSRTKEGSKDAPRTYSRNYIYNPQTKRVTFAETGDVGLRPSYISSPEDLASVNL